LPEAAYIIAGINAASTAFDMGLFINPAMFKPPAAPPLPVTELTTPLIAANEPPLAPAAPLPLPKMLDRESSASHF
jgi:hypothetical protein